MLQPLLLWVFSPSAVGQCFVYRKGNMEEVMMTKVLLEWKSSQVPTVYGCIVQEYHVFYRAHRVEREKVTSENFCHPRANFIITLIALHSASLVSANGIAWWSCCCSVTVRTAQKRLNKQLPCYMSLSPKRKLRTWKHGKYLISFLLSLHTQTSHLFQNTHDSCIDIVFPSNNLPLSQDKLQYFMSLCK